MAENRDIKRLEKDLERLRAQLADNERCLKGLKQAGEALLEAEERFRFVADNVSDIIYTLDPSGIVTYINQSIERVSSFKVKELLGQPFLRFIHPDDLQGLLESFERTIGGHLEPYQYRVLDKDGGTFLVSTFSLPHYRDDVYEGVTGIMTVIRHDA